MFLGQERPAAAVPLLKSRQRHNSEGLLPNVRTASPTIIDKPGFDIAANMTSPDLWTGVYVLGLAGLLAMVLLASHKTHMLARDLRSAWPLSVLEHAPLAVLSILLFGATFHSWGQALGLVTGASLSNMIIASAMAIERATPVGFQTFPMYIAACLSQVPVGFGIWTAMTTQKVAVGLIIYTIHLHLLITYTIAVPLWRTRKDESSPRTTEAQCLEESAASIDAENGTVPTCSVDTVHVAPAVLGQPSDSGKGTTSTVHDLETQPLLRAGSSPDVDKPDAWQAWNRYQFALALLILCSAVTSFVIHRLAEHLHISDKHPAILSGLLLATCPSIPTIGTLTFGAPSAEEIDEIKVRCSNNLVLLATGLLIVTIGFNYDAEPLLILPMLTALFAVLGLHLRGYWWLIGVAFLITSFFFLAFYTVMVLGFGDSHDDDPWLTTNIW